MSKEQITEKMNEECTKCGGFAGFDKSPEGECCGICGEWVCKDCIDNDVCLKEFVLPDGTTVAEDSICKECSERLGLHKLVPVREL